MGYTSWNLLVVLDLINSGYSGKTFHVTEQRPEAPDLVIIQSTMYNLQETPNFSQCTYSMYVVFVEFVIRLSNFCIQEIHLSEYWVTFLSLSNMYKTSYTRLSEEEKVYLIFVTFNVRKSIQFNIQRMKNTNSDQ